MTARRFLAALLLAVLAVAGGTPAAAGGGSSAGARAAVLPTRSSAGPAPTASGPAGIRPPTDRSGYTDRSARTGYTNRPGYADRSARTDRTDRTVRTRPAVGVHRSGPASGTQPWAVAEHPRTPQHLPPPGPGSLPALTSGVPLPHPVPGAAPAAPSVAAGRFRAALPGVRGPPRAAAVHRPGDLSPVPPLNTAVPFAPS